MYRTTHLEAGNKIVRLSDLTGEDLRHLAGLRDSAPARRQERADHALRRQLARLSALMPDADREAVTTELAAAHPALVLEQHFDAFMAARDLRDLLPWDERGELYLPQDVLPSDDEADSVAIEMVAA